MSLAYQVIEAFAREVKLLPVVAKVGMLAGAVGRKMLLSLPFKNESSNGEAP